MSEKVDFKPGEVIIIDLILADLEAKLAAAKEALEFYANCYPEWNAVHFTKRAREALEKLK